jgi:hypothetical protein
MKPISERRRRRRAVTAPTRMPTDRSLDKA